MPLQLGPRPRIFFRFPFQFSGHARPLPRHFSSLLTSQRLDLYSDRVLRPAISIHMPGSSRLSTPSHVFALQGLHMGYETLSGPCKLGQIDC
jgi:hypothetical protein